MFSFKIDYKKNFSELCKIGAKYNTDKSPLKQNLNDPRHTHPYTLFYDGLFKNYRNKEVTIAELGILEGSSLLMWNEYFPNSKIYGFEYNEDLIKSFKQKYNNLTNISLHKVNVKDENNISEAFRKVNVQYDIIIEDTTHEFQDQIRVIRNVYKYLKPGGILIIEDIFKKYKEQAYYALLKEYLHEFQSYYFVTLDHKNKFSGSWDNDKLLILVKGGGEPIFKNNNKMTIITPSYRLTNLLTMKESINFNYVNEWIIVYDGSKIKQNPELFKGDSKIKELVYENSYSTSGNAQRNFALENIANKNDYIYYLDDDNIIHPSLYKLLEIIDNNKLYTFNQENRIKGDDIRVNHIDTAMMLIDFNLCKDIRWVLDKYNADGYYIKSCYDKNSDKHIYVDNNLCYYNRLQR